MNAHKKTRFDNIPADMEGKVMYSHPLLSNNFPEMTDDELNQCVRHMGCHLVSWYNEEVKCIVSSRHSSIECFIDKNAVTIASPGAIRRELYRDGKFTLLTEHGEVGIYL